MSRVGVFGGSFDPVHSAHARLVELALEQLRLDEVLLIPAARSPLKDPAVADAVERLQMLRLAFQADGRTRIDERELRRGGASPTVRTLESLHAEARDRRLVLLLGQDSFDQLERWVQPERISTLCEIAVLARPGGGNSRPQRWRESSVHWLDAAPADLSSSEIRRTLSQGERPAGLHDRVFAYIREHSLYGFGATA